jgi:hypothetical protein
VQVVADNVPAVGLPQLTVPVGVVGVPADVSNTVAVQVVVALTGTGLGVQLILSNVERVLTLSA